MVMDPLPEVDDLIWLFGSDPEYPYEADEQAAGYALGWRESWPYTRLIFTHSSGGSTLRVNLEPGYEQVRLSLSHEGTEVLDLLLREVTGLSVERLPHKRDVLRLDFPTSFPGHSLLVTLSPQIFVG